jgi:tetratricopeptide (TPR) repeat protein
MQRGVKISIVIVGILVIGALVYGAFHSTVNPPEANKDVPANPPQLQSAHNSPAKSADSLHSIKALELELQKRPNHSPILLRLAQLSTEIGKPADAEKYLRQLLAVEPNSLEARIELGRILFQQGNVQGALAETQNVLKLDPKNADALYNLGAIHGNLNNDEMARKYWLQAIAAAPASESAQKARTGLKELKPERTP